MEKEYKISWLKVIGVIVLIAVIIAIIWLVYPKKEAKPKSNSIYITNINMMKEAGFEFFKGNNLPTEMGSANRISLADMIGSNLLIEFNDEEGNACNTEDSYVQATKTGDAEYAMKVFLSCKNKSDFIVTTIYNKVECTNCNTNTNIIKPNNNSNNNGNANVDNKPNTNNNTTNNKPTTTTVNKVYNINYIYNNGTNCSNGNCVSNVYYTVTFDANGGYVSGSTMTTRTVRKGDAVNEVVPSREGYTFLGWYLNGNKYDFASPVNGKITLVANWKKKDSNTPVTTNKYTVTFNSNGGSKVNSQKVIEGDTAWMPSDPTRSCYDFAGWYYYNANGNLVRFDFNTPIYRDIILYAEWDDNGACYIENYRIDFESNGGTSVSTKYVEEGNKVTKPSNPRRDCYDFIAWYYYDEDGDYVKYNFSNRVYEDLTLYAEWEDDGTCNVNKYKVTFNTDGGSSIKAKTVSEGGRVTKPTNPTKSGFKFNTWYYYNDNGYYVEYNFNNRVYRDITLYAEWIPTGNGSLARYCKVKTTSYYPTGYISTSTSSINMPWTIRLDELYGARNVKVNNAYHLSSYNSYQSAFNRRYNKGISMVNSNYQVVTSTDNVVSYSASAFMNSSLKSGNFTESVSVARQVGNYWYIDVEAKVNNTYGVTPYYANNLGYSVYFVPYTIEVKYTDVNDCVTDYIKNSNKYYRDYEMIR